MDAVIGLVGVVVGYLVRLGTELFMDERAERRRRTMARADLQRETLTELQDQVNLMSQRAVEIVIERQHRSGKWDRARPAAADAAERRAFERAFALHSRVIDRDLRGAVGRLLDLRTAVLEAQSSEEANDKVSLFWPCLMDVTERLGASIRDLY